MPGHRPQLQAGPPDALATDSETGHTCVLGFCQTGCWAAHSCPIMPQRLPKDLDEKGERLEPPHRGTTGQAGA